MVLIPPFQIYKNVTVAHTSCLDKRLWHFKSRWKNPSALYLPTSTPSIDKKVQLIKISVLGTACLNYQGFSNAHVSYRRANMYRNINKELLIVTQSQSLPNFLSLFSQSHLAHTRGIKTTGLIRTLFHLNVFFNFIPLLACSIASSTRKFTNRQPNHIKITIIKNKCGHVDCFFMEGIILVSTVYIYIYIYSQGQNMKKSFVLFFYWEIPISCYMMAVLSNQ